MKPEPEETFVTRALKGMWKAALSILYILTIVGTLLVGMFTP